MPVILWQALLLASDANTQTAEGEQVEEKINIFSGYLSESIWTLVWFGLLVAILGKFVWKPMLAGLKTREDHISGEIAKAENTNKQAKDTLKNYQDKLSSIELEGKELAKKHLGEAEKKGQTIVARAMQEADSIKAKAREDAKKTVVAARGTLVDEAGAIVCTLGSEIIGRVITPEDNQRLIEQAVDELKKSYISEGA